MFEKDLNYGNLLDYYGALLQPRQREAMSFYYNDDLSLSEIADEMGISRQGVRDAIKRGEAQLTELEAALGIAKSHIETKKLVDSITSELTDVYDTLCDDNAKLKLLSQIEKIKMIADN